MKWKSVAVAVAVKQGVHPYRPAELAALSAPDESVLLAEEKQLPRVYELLHVGP
jgi:hypothetical protein